MDPADAIDVARTVQGQPGHVEQARRGRCTREIEEALHRDSELTHEIAEMPEDEIVPERIVARGDRSMSSEHAGRGDGLERGLERQTQRQVLAQQLQDEECSVALVEVPYSGLDAK